MSIPSTNISTNTLKNAIESVRAKTIENEFKITNTAETIRINLNTENYVLSVTKEYLIEINLIVNAVVFSTTESGTALTINLDDLPDSVQRINIVVNNNIYGGPGLAGAGANDDEPNKNGTAGGDGISINCTHDRDIIIYIYNNATINGGGGGGGGDINSVHYGGHGSYYHNGVIAPNWNNIFFNTSYITNGAAGGALNHGGGSRSYGNLVHYGGDAGKRIHVTGGVNISVILVDSDSGNQIEVNFTGQHRTLARISYPMSKYGYIVSASNEYYRKDKSKGIDIIESLPIRDEAG